MVLGWMVLRKMIRIAQGATASPRSPTSSPAATARAAAGGLVTLIAVVGIVPYIALQLKAVSAATPC
jgi:Na+/proline symporter